MSRIRPLAKRILPAPVVRYIRRRLSRRRCSAVLDSWAHAESVLTGVPVDSTGSPTPWLTYPAIAFLNQFDYSEKAVFEWGAGASSSFWSRRARLLITVEHDGEWIAKVRPKLGASAQLIQETDPASYCRSIERLGHRFDVISIDGLHRADCAEMAVRHLASGGMIIFDNSDEFIATCLRVRQHGFLQIDFSGLGPVRDSPWTTSIFLRGEFGFRATSDRQPQPLPGSSSVQLDADPRIGSGADSSNVERRS